MATSCGALRPNRPVCVRFIPFCLAPCLLLVLASCASKPSATTVILYCSLDDIFARPIIAEFEKKTGIDVREVFDSESTKTVGLANRILMEAARPRADVFWNGEFSRTIFLKTKTALDVYRSPSSNAIPGRYKDREGYWTGYACRARVICYNPTRLAARKLKPPQSIFELKDRKWKGRVAICDPMIGTAASWVTALYLELGEETADAFFRSLRSNDVRIVPGNSVVADMVVKGLTDVGVTDTDDVFLRKTEGRSIESVLPDQDGIGTLVIPATVTLIKGAPHPIEAKRLIDYLLSKEVEAALARHAGHMPVRPAENVAGAGSPNRRLAEVRQLGSLVTGQSGVSFEEIGKHVDDTTRRVKHLLGL